MNALLKKFLQLDLENKSTKVLLNIFQKKTNKGHNLTFYNGQPSLLTFLPQCIFERCYFQCINVNVIAVHIQ